MALYTEAYTIVRTDAGLSESVNVKDGLHQESVLSPLLFAVVMDVVSNGLPSELLYADDLVLMAPTMEQRGKRVVELRASLLDKGLKVSTGKSKVMVGSSALDFPVLTSKVMVGSSGGSWKKRARRDPCKTTRPIHLVKLFTDSSNTSNL